MFKKSTLAAATTLALAAPLAAQAQTSEWFSTPPTYEASRYFDNRWYLTPFGSYILTDSNRQADNGWGGGLAVGKPIHPNWNLEFRTMYEELDAKSGGPGKYKNWTLTLDALWFPIRREGVAAWKERSVQPYLVAGVRHQRRRRRLQRVELGAECRPRLRLAVLGLGTPRGRRALPLGQQQRSLRLGRQLRGLDCDRGSPDPAWPGPARGRSAARRAPAPAPPPPPAPVVKPAPPPPPPPTQVSRSFSLQADGLFAFDSAVVSDVARQRADAVISALRQVGSTATSVKVIGHTDPMGTEAYNQKLSEQRARASPITWSRKACRPRSSPPRAAAKRNCGSPKPTARPRVRRRRSRR